MEHQKILNLLNETRNSKFVTIKRNIIIDTSNAFNQIFSTEVLIRI